jgi:hypothetical protein
MLLWEGTYISWACLKKILAADCAGRRLKQCSISSAAARRWLVSDIMFLEINLTNQKIKTQPR